VATVRDIASGATLRRAGVRRVLRYVGLGDADVIIFSSIDRAAREAASFQTLFRSIYEARGRVAIADRGTLYETQTELLRETSLLQILAEYELKAIDSRAAAGKTEALRRSGLIQKPHYGYSLEKQERAGVVVSVPVIDDNAAVVKQVVAHYLSGSSTSAICKQLNMEGVPTPNRSAFGWNSGQIWRILSNCSIYGGGKWVRTHHVGGQPLSITYSYPPIVSASEAEQVAVQLESRRLGKRGAPSPFRGLLYCSSCGRGGGRRGPSYWCNSKRTEFSYRTLGRVRSGNSCNHSVAAPLLLRALRLFLQNESDAILQEGAQLVSRIESLTKLIQLLPDEATRLEAAWKEARAHKAKIRVPSGRAIERPVAGSIERDTESVATRSDLICELEGDLLKSHITAFRIGIENGDLSLLEALVERTQASLTAGNWSAVNDQLTLLKTRVEVDFGQPDRSARHKSIRVVSYLSYP
jgi:DNA invertase Pin-like site-specific DNA recombinase